MTKSAEEIKKEINDWKIFFIDHGLETNHISDYLSYISSLIENNVPVIFEIKHLSQLIGINTAELLKMIYSPSKKDRDL
ncbi:hypothetical protein [Citrobacter youngae]|uniref:hypothetical protein n=1 Tax=Citrobacter youngae TaxID=133448 RepID=UPI003EE28347